MEPEGPLLHSQELATCPYPEPDETRSRSSSSFLKIHFNTILFTPNSCRWHLSLWFLSVSCVLPKVCPGAICTFRFVPCSTVICISPCEQWVMNLQGTAEINKLKVIDVLLFCERHCCVCSTKHRVLLIQLSVASTM
jgi:hypothetical protein